jgi:hypothetical protein
MFYVALLLVVILLVVANLAAQRAEKPMVVVLIAGLAITIAPQFLLVFFPPVMLSAALLVGAVAVWRYYFDKEPRVFLPLSLAAVGIAFGICILHAAVSTTFLRGEFSYVSMADRLPARPASPAPTLSDASGEQLAGLERDVESRASARPEARRRLEQLEYVREHPLGVFLGRPAFCVSWWSGQLSDDTLRDGLREDAPRGQPGRRIPFTWSAATLQKPPEDAERLYKELAALHGEAVVDFVNPAGFGYFRDRTHVAGFQEHRLSRLPDAPAPWVLQTLELIGCARQESPAVYVSDKLPRMDELRTAQTRPPDEFETLGLAALQRGEDLFLRQTAEGRRMLGAIRNGRQCQSCHEGPRGELLGVFSYTLVRPPH